MMGPFVPDLISDQLNLVVALLLGIGFGFVLEQAGFSSSRRLAGVFYGYDFTVLRVFFTAAVTAMTGVLLLGHFGLLDLDLIFVNPTWLAPAIVGGVIMGVGFLLGGYCPGTSVCAAAIGKVDAMVFVGGGLLGVLAFGEGYPALRALLRVHLARPDQGVRFARDLTGCVRVPVHRRRRRGVRRHHPDREAGRRRRRTVARVLDEEPRRRRDGGLRAGPGVRRAARSEDAPHRPRLRCRLPRRASRRDDGRRRAGVPDRGPRPEDPHHRHPDAQARSAASPCPDRRTSRCGSSSARTR